MATHRPPLTFTTSCSHLILCCWLHVVLQTFFVDDDLKDACQLDAVLTVVDSKHLLQHLDEVKPADVVNEAGGSSRSPGTLV